MSGTLRTADLGLRIEEAARGESAIRNHQSAIHAAGMTGVI
jgi:hypothetical protein